MQIFKYTRLFSVEIIHNYYRSGYSNDFIIVPTTECNQLLSNYGLLFKTTVYGFIVLADVSESGNLKKTIDHDLKFTFTLLLKNPYLVNFSELPVKVETNNLYYFNNKEVNSVDVFNKVNIELLLNKGNNVTRDDLVNFKSGTYRYTHSGSGTSKTSTLIFIDENLYLPSQAVSSNNGEFNFQYDLGKYPPGRCRLEIESNTVDEFYSGNNLNKKNLFGIIEIFTGVPDDNKFIINSNQISFKQYKIAFLNRSTTWRYNVINKSGKTLDNPGIIETETPWNFTPESILVFVSDEKMPLKEKTIKGIEFRTDIENSATDLANNLPNASIEQIKPEDIENSIIYSDIFIYI